MAFDEGLHERVAESLSEKIEFNSRKMFGGICYLLNGNMLGGILGDKLIVRVGKARYEELLKLENTQVFDVTGKVMKGWILVDQEAIEAEDQLDFWLQKGIDFAAGLPAKEFLE